jgi:hypothetical protein
MKQRHVTIHKYDLAFYAIVLVALTLLGVYIYQRDKPPVCQFEGKECPNAQAVYVQWDDLDTYNKNVVKTIQSISINKKGFISVEYMQYGELWKENMLTLHEFETMFGFSAYTK